MSYEVKKDEMVGRYVADFQAELSLAKSVEGFDLRPNMPYGYPIRIYHPYHSVRLPRHTEFTHHEHTKLSNDVPWVLGMELVDSNVIGVYNPQKDKCPPESEL